MVEVSIIIVNYNTKDLILQCIESIQKETKDIIYEIIIVDNNSKDGSCDSIKNKFSEVLLIESIENLGFGKANNLGVQHAKGEYVFLLNSDTILINNAIKILYNYMISIPEVGLCGANLYDAHQNPTTSFYQMMPSILSDLDLLSGGRYGRARFGKNINFNYINKPIYLKGYSSGADMMMKKKLFVELGGFDSEFFMYYEDTQLNWKIRRAGYKIASVPYAKIMHLEGSSELIKENTERRLIKSKFIYFEKTNKKNQINLMCFLTLLLIYKNKLIYLLKSNKDMINYWNLLLRLTKEEYVLFKNKINK